MLSTIQERHSSSTQESRLRRKGIQLSAEIEIRSVAQIQNEEQEVPARLRALASISAEPCHRRCCVRSFFQKEVWVSGVVFVGIRRAINYVSEPFVCSVTFPISYFLMSVHVVARHGMSPYLDR